VAKSKGLLRSLRTARSAPLSGEAVSSEPVVAYAETKPAQEPPTQVAAAGQADNPFAALFGGGRQAAAQDDAEGDDARMEAAALEIAPLPPKRPRGL